MNFYIAATKSRPSFSSPQNSSKQIVFDFRPQAELSTDIIDLCLRAGSNPADYPPNNIQTLFQSPQATPPDGIH